MLGKSFSSAKKADTKPNSNYGYAAEARTQSESVQSKARNNSTSDAKMRAQNRYYSSTLTIALGTNLTNGRYSSSVISTSSTRSGPGLEQAVKSRVSMNPFEEPTDYDHTMNPFDQESDDLLDKTNPFSENYNRDKNLNPFD